MWGTEANLCDAGFVEQDAGDEQLPRVIIELLLDEAEWRRGRLVDGNPRVAHDLRPLLDTAAALAGGHCRCSSAKQRSKLRLGAGAGGHGAGAPLLAHVLHLLLLVLIIKLAEINEKNKETYRLVAFLESFLDLKCFL